MTAWLLFLAGILAGVLCAQTASLPITREEVRAQARITRRLKCLVTKRTPVALFDFQIHSTYFADIPSSQLKESDSLLLRVYTQPLKDENGRPFQPPKPPVLMESFSSLEGMQVSRRNYVAVSGSIATGVGEYRHILAIDDGKGLGCVTQWNVKAKAGDALRRFLVLRPGEVADPRLLTFGRQRTVEKLPGALRVAVFLNADSRSWRRALADISNTVALASGLRRVAEDPRVAEIAITVFSLEDQKVLFDQSFQPAVNFRSVGAAFRQLKPGEVEFTDLVARSEARFVAQMLRDRDVRIAQADLLLFLGARSPVTDKLREEDRESIQPRRDAISAYLVTNPFQWRSPVARDVIGHIVKKLNGKEREIRVPNDLAEAVDNVLEDARRARATPAATVPQFSRLPISRYSNCNDSATPSCVQ